MSFTDTQQGRPRIGIPWRTSADEANANSTGVRGKSAEKGTDVIVEIGAGE